MKKIISFLLVLTAGLFVAGMSGCNDSDKLSKKDELDNVSLLGVSAHICNTDHKILYYTSTDLNSEVRDFTELNLDGEYYLELHCHPGNIILPYESVKIIYNEQDIEITELEDWSGIYYRLKGLKECDKSLVEITSNAGYSLSIPVSFVNNNLN